MPGFDNRLMRVETQRFGPFTFRLGIDSPQIETALMRVDDAHELFDISPLAQVANRLEREVVVSSVFGTNSIEGGTLTEEETADALQLDIFQVQEVEQRRAVNIKAAYDLARGAVDTKDWQLDLGFICAIHAAITRDLPHNRNVPGQMRDNSKDVITHVGDAAHGGVYKPPQYGGDVRMLMQALVAWHRQLVDAGVPALIRAPLMHLYYEWIHPFWDGNGRVGRVIEATLLQAAGYRYAPFAMARYYLEHIDEYFSLFNTCRKARENGLADAHSAFVLFHLEGMRQVINRLHARVNRIVAVLLFESDVKQLFDRKQLNARQYTILAHLLDKGSPWALDDLQKLPWYGALYLNRTDKTRQRDLRKLRDMRLIFLDTDKRIWPGFLQPAGTAKLN
jgi:Fic family protein